jgi:hypothetical protein
VKKAFGRLHGGPEGWQADTVSVERVLRVASLEESERFDAEDLARSGPEARIAAVERLRRAWFGDFAAERRLERVLRCTDLDGHPIPAHRRARRRGPR